MVFFRSILRLLLVNKAFGDLLYCGSYGRATELVCEICEILLFYFVTDNIFFLSKSRVPSQFLQFNFPNQMYAPCANIFQSRPYISFNDNDTLCTQAADLVRITSHRISSIRRSAATICVCAQRHLRHKPRRPKYQQFE